jgi:hypothetical protein
MRLLGCALAAATLVACSVAPSDHADVRVRSSSAPRIIGGTPSTAAQDATVLLVLPDSFCTGTLIAPNLVLTARHCTSEMAGNDDCQYFTTDDDVTQIGVILGVDADDSQTPVATGKKLFHETSTDGCGQDIALVLLDHDIPGATIAPVRFTPVTTSDVGIAVGYGDGDDHGDPTPSRYQRAGVSILAVGPATYDYKTKKGATLPADVTAGELLSSESTCFGDSGGPLFDASGNVIGVTSRGIDDLCTDRPSVWEDVVSHQTLIENAANAAGHPLGAPTTPTPSDPPADPPSDPTPADPPSDDPTGGSATAHASDPAPTAQSGCSASSAPIEPTGLAGVVVGAALVLATALRRRR